MHTGSSLYLGALLPTAAMMALTACGGGGEGADDSPPIDMQTGVVATDLDSDGRTDLAVDGHADVVTGEGPQVLYNDATRPGTLQAARAL